MSDTRRKPTVFISYAHADEGWKDRLVTHLKFLAEERQFDLWDDRRIGAGDDWRARIAAAVAGARVAVLLVSADFLSSDFIRKEELPPLLARHARDELRIVPVIVEPCPWKQVAWLSRLQVRPRDDQALSRRSRPESEDELASIATEVSDLLRGVSPAPPAPPAGREPNAEHPTPRAAGERATRSGGDRSLNVGRDIIGSPIAQGDNIVIVDAPSGRVARGPRKRKPAPAPPAAGTTRKRYLDWVAERYRYLELKGMGVSDRVALRMPLAELYVPLSARVELPRADAWERQPPRVAGRPASAEEREAMGAALSRPTRVDRLLRQFSGLVVLGDPGAGKTTLLKHLALQLAQGGGKELGLDGRLPVLVPLSAYATALAAGDVSLSDFIAGYFPSHGVELPVGALLREALERGEALVLLDGLDEVKDGGRRGTVVDRVVNFFSLHRPAGNKFVLTSRIVGYREVRPVAEGLGECTLVDFDDEEIAAFVEKWTGAVERAAHGDTPTAAREAQREKGELLAAVAHNAGVRALAANPLLLTILALMKRQGIALPERRVELYKNYVETLLKHWNLARGLDRPQVRDLDVVETLRVLGPLALWMHETSPGVGLVKREAVRDRLERIYATRATADPEVAARRLIEDLRLDTGLLLERGAGQYGFMHLTFQEYLAATALAQQAQKGVETLVRALARHVGDPTWREVSLLAIGYLGIVQGWDEAASEVVQRLLTEPPGEPGEAVVLCGEAVADAWPGGVTAACRKATVDALLATMRGDAPARTRAAAGDTLARVGDPRLRADAWHLPDEPLLGFVEIPEGPFVMGDEKRRATLPRYFIARYPVTVAQFKAFIDDGGKVRGQHALRDPATRPVRWVRWREALAYADWLTEKLRAWPHTPEPLAGLLRAGTNGKPWRVTLPSEAEWEKAARGTDGRIYPWGDDGPDEQRANFELNVGHTSAVGCFPRGASPYRIEEMSGNVWEWTRNLYEGGQDALSAPDDKHRAVRGGAFRNNPSNVRAAVRYRVINANAVIGFRVVVSPFLSLWTLNPLNSASLSSTAGPGEMREAHPADRIQRLPKVTSSVTLCKCRVRARLPPQRTSPVSPPGGATTS